MSFVPPGEFFVFFGNIIYLCLQILLLNGCSKTDVTTSLPEINAENNKSVGASANDLLSSSKYSTLKIEIQYMPGFQPDPASISNLNSFINSLANKPNGVIITPLGLFTSELMKLFKLLIDAGSG